MKTNNVRHKLLAGEAAIGCFMGLGSPNVAELLTRAGLDWLVIETEHNNLDTAQIEHILMAVQGSGAMPIVRVASAQQVYIQRALDTGAMGVLVPMVRTVEEAEAIVAATRFPPVGRRSFGPLRASHYSLDNADYLGRANDNMLVALIVETREMLDNLEEIAAVPGIDVLFLGPFDLCLALGLNPLQLPLAGDRRGAGADAGSGPQDRRVHRLCGRYAGRSARVAGAGRDLHQLRSGLRVADARHS